MEIAETRGVPVSTGLDEPALFATRPPRAREHAALSDRPGHGTTLDATPFGGARS
jgi:hypothetical protein